MLIKSWLARPIQRRRWCALRRANPNGFWARVSLTQFRREQRRLSLALCSARVDRPKWSSQHPVVRLLRYLYKRRAGARARALQHELDLMDKMRRERPRRVA